MLPCGKHWLKRGVGLWMALSAMLARFLDCRLSIIEILLAAFDILSTAEGLLAAYVAALASGCKSQYGLLQGPGVEGAQWQGTGFFASHMLRLRLIR